MLFLLFLFLFVSIGNIIVVLIFPYHAAIMAMGLQFSFFVLSLIIFIHRFRKKRKIFRSFLLLAMHGSALFLVVYLFSHVAQVYRDQGDSDAFRSGLRGFFRHEAPPDRENNPDDEDQTQSGALKISAPFSDKRILFRKNKI
ncbi:MAG: hypothetical protein OEV66_01065 [Spirochaetia bacterium]|nr:hypothetical protein [Spirochaetia bacterium]